MEISQPITERRRNFYCVIAIVFILSGALSATFTAATTYDSATRPWDADSSILSMDVSKRESIKPAPEEWPLAVARSSAYGGSEGRSNRYTVEIIPVRGTELLRLDVIGRSPTLTTAFGAWLTKAFAHDLSESLASRGSVVDVDGSKSRIVQAPGPAVPLRLHPATLLISLLTPLLLFTSGIFLFQASKANQQAIQRSSD